MTDTCCAFSEGQPARARARMSQKEIRIDLRVQRDDEKERIERGITSLNLKRKGFCAFTGNVIEAHHSKSDEHIQNVTGGGKCV